LKKAEATPSKKRLLLEKNLKAVVKNVEMGKTPLRIAELWVYGSFIRPKEEPGDVEHYATGDLETDRKEREDISDAAWGIEVYHRGIESV
jgi:hypothetical protein